MRQAGHRGPTASCASPPGQRQQHGDLGARISSRVTRPCDNRLQWLVIADPAPWRHRIDTSCSCGRSTQRRSPSRSRGLFRPFGDKQRSGDVLWVVTTVNQTVRG